MNSIYGKIHEHFYNSVRRVNVLALQKNVQRVRSYFSIYYYHYLAADFLGTVLFFITKSFIKFYFIPQTAF